MIPGPERRKTAGKKREKKLKQNVDSEIRLIYLNFISIYKKDFRLVPDSSRQGQAQIFGLWFMDFALWMTQGYQLDHSLSQRLLTNFFDNVLLEHIGLIRVLPLADYLFFGLSR